MTGDLTLHGVTKSVTFSVDAQLVDGEIEIATTDPVEVVLTDYDIEAPCRGPSRRWRTRAASSSWSAWRRAEAYL